ncbi:MAG: 2-hydroxyacyl-CoA dehydratase, partial [Acidobacteria bacterium]|nr:2-hydroxyacyl-CoA dehydratase [Acidobacteriota bacterium]
MTLTATRIFDEWRNKTLDDALLECRDMVESPEFETARRWRDAGGKIVGHFQVYFPEEIVHAAGMLPFKVRGAPAEPNRADSHFGSYLCSILKTSLELALSDVVSMDLFVSHPICDAARNLAAIWGRNVDYPSQILYLPQNPNSTGSIDYLRHEYDRMRRVVEEVAGKEITDDDLRNSIAVFNENRRLLRELYDIKRDTPWLIGSYFPAADAVGEMRRLAWAGAAGLVVLLLSVIAAIVMGRLIARPIRRLARAANSIGDLEFASVSELPASRIRELDDQARAFNSMVSGLHWFENYVPKTLVRRLLEQG